MRRLAGVLFLLAIPTTAHALEQTAHRAITIAACRAEGLPKDFCARVGTEVYNVDFYEWDDMSAHGQIDGKVGGNAAACEAANKALERERSLGNDIRESLDELASGPSKTISINIAVQLGRALHTLQDNCAHNGMINPQHAWASATDTCTGSKTSPDAQPEARTCAERETKLAMATFVSAVRNARISKSILGGGIPLDTAHFPRRESLCEYLHGETNWDGKDTRWNIDVTIPYLRDQLAHALTTDDSSIGDICASGLDVIARQDPADDVSVADPPWCLKLTAFCLGAADAPDAAPPWAADEDEAADSADSAGCAVGGGGSSGGLVGAALLGLSLVSRTRRRRAA